VATDYELNRMDEDLSYDYSESFDSFISGSSKNVKSVLTDLESHVADIQSCSVDTDCLSPLSTQRSVRWTASCSSVEERTPNLLASRSALRFSRHFSELEKYTADFVGSDADLNPNYYSSFESLTGGSDAESDGDEADLTVFSAASDADTRTYSSVSQEPSVRWSDEDKIDDFSSDSQHLTSQYSSVFR